MQKTITLLTAILIGATASFSLAAPAPASKASQAQNASKPQQTKQHEGKGHDMAGMHDMSH